MTKILEAHHISKKYLIYHQQQCPYSTLVETLSQTVKKAFSKHHKSSKEYEELWALKDIDLSIEPGERLGIIGKNGAGKSTLLKVISRITHPTSGRIKIRGRVASLLEVGTGFHPELTGSENIFLNGAILGMTRREIKQKFDAIVAFGEIEKFLDTPVKRFSSGMYMRLGFAIAAHLDPDLLILDEVLSVGDSQFQEKCIRKLRELEQSGRTIIFVSHDMSTLLNLCNKGIFLEKGQLKEVGPIDACVSAYMKMWQQCSTSWSGQVGDTHLSIKQASLKKPEPHREFYYQDEKICIEIDYEILKASPDLCLGINICNKRNQMLARASSLDDPQAERFSSPGKHRAMFEFNASLFHPGEYWVKVEAVHHFVKWITTDDIVLKLHVYSRQNNERLTASLDYTGISLGNRWTLNTYYSYTASR